MKNKVIKFVVLCVLSSALILSVTNINRSFQFIFGNISVIYVIRYFYILMFKKEV